MIRVRFIRGVVVFLAVLSVSVVLSTGRAYAASTGPAISSSYPPEVTSGYGSGHQGKVSYAISQDFGQTNIKETTIKIYVPVSQSTAHVTVHNYNMCRNNTVNQLGYKNSYDQVYVAGYAGTSGHKMASYQLTGSTSPSTFYGTWQNNCKSAVKTLTLHGGTIQTNIGYRVYTFVANGYTATAAGGYYLNLFWMSGPNGVVFSQDSGQSPKSFGYQLSSPIPSQAGYGTGTTYYHTALPFGSSCNVTAAQKNTKISFYDLDTGNSTVQPRALKVRLWDKTSGGGVSLKHSGSGSMSGGAGTDYIYTINGGNVQTVNALFTARPGHKYELRIYSAFYNNTLQLKLPFSAVYYYASCQNANLKGTTTLDSSNTVLPGQDIKWSHQLSNISKTGIAEHTKSYIHSQVTNANGTVVASMSNKKELVPSKFNTTMLPGAKRPNAPRHTVFHTTSSEVGYTVCEWLTWSSDVSGGKGNGSTKSDTYCAVVGKQPKLQIWGGDIRVGGFVDVSQSKVDGNYFGSWAEYGSFIAKLNQDSAFASGAALAGSDGASSNSPASLNKLTFANKTNDGGYGEFDNPSLLLSASKNSIYTTMATNALQIPSGTTPFNSNISNLSGAYTINGNTSIAKSQIPAGKTILIHVNGTVTITGNITYPSSFGSLGDIPQVIIVANNINIKSNVSRIDAWLLAGNSDGTSTINTCYNVGTLTTNNCKTFLETNGPVVSDEAKFRRTAGSDDTSHAGDPAETLDLRADSYLWEYNQAAKHVIPTTVQVTQLPPRY